MDVQKIIMWLLAVMVAFIGWAYTDAIGQIDTLDSEVQRLKTDTALQQATNERVLEQLERIERKVEQNVDSDESEAIDREVSKRMRAILNQIEAEAKKK